MNVKGVSRFAAQLYEGVACDTRWQGALGALARIIGVGALAIVRSDTAGAATRARGLITDIAGADNERLAPHIAEHIETLDGLRAARECASICARHRPASANMFNTVATGTWLERVTGNGVRIRWFPLSSDEGGANALLLASYVGAKCIPPAPDMLAHLAGAVRLRRQMSAITRMAAVGERVMERFTLPLAVVNGGARLIHANMAGRLWLRDIAQMPAPSDGDFDPPADRIASFARALCGGETVPRALLLPNTEGRRILVVGVPLEGRAADDDGSPLALLVAHNHGVHRPSWVPLLAATFSLSPAEQRLLEQMVFDDSLDSAVNTLGISKETARSHLKSIFAKTGTKRQAGLMRMVTNVAQLH